MYFWIFNTNDVLFLCFICSREAKKQWRCPLCPGEQDWPMLVRHLRGAAHSRTPAQIRALLPPGYKTRPPRNRRNAEAEENPEDEDLVDEEEVDDDLEEEEVQDDEDLVDEEAAAASDTDSMHTVSTVALSTGTTPAPSRPPSPVVIRISSNGINAIPGLEDYASEGSRSRATSTASTASTVPGVFGGGALDNLDPGDVMFDLVNQGANDVPPPSRPGSRGNLHFLFLYLFIPFCKFLYFR